MTVKGFEPPTSGSEGQRHIQARLYRHGLKGGIVFEFLGGEKRREQEAQYRDVGVNLEWR